MEVFAGNPQDPKTFKAQIDQLVQRFGVKQVTWVGDRGMIKTVQISELKDAGFHYITAITKPPIDSKFTGSTSRNIIYLVFSTDYGSRGKIMEFTRNTST